MGFSHDNTGTGETLYVASGDSTRRHAAASPRSTPRTFALHVVGDLQAAPSSTRSSREPAPAISSPSSRPRARPLATTCTNPNCTDSAIGQLDKTTGRVIASRCSRGNPQGTAWAFAFWGGDFYTFTAPGNGATVVNRFNPADGSLVTVATALGPDRRRRRFDVRSGAVSDKLEGMRPGLVSFVGAGPGDPGLRTARAAQRLAEADVVFEDEVPAGRLVELAREGKRVVRLVAGDALESPAVVAQALAVAAAGVPFEVVPGVGARGAAAAFAGVLGRAVRVAGRRRRRGAGERSPRCGGDDRRRRGHPVAAGRDDDGGRGGAPRARARG